MPEERWEEIGDAAELAKTPLQQLTVGKTKIALTARDGVFHAISGVCNHVGGPLGDGRLDGDYVVCPWHGSEFALDEGRVINGPATQPQPCFAVREHAARIEIKTQA